MGKLRASSTPKLSLVKKKSVSKWEMNNMELGRVNFTATQMSSLNNEKYGFKIPYIRSLVPLNIHRSSTSYVA